MYLYHLLINPLGNDETFARLTFMLLIVVIVSWLRLPYSSSHEASRMRSITYFSHFKAVSSPQDYGYMSMVQVKSQTKRATSPAPLFPTLSDDPHDPLNLLKMPHRDKMNGIRD